MSNFESFENKKIKYCNSLLTYSRFKTRIVNIGNIPLGGEYPIRIQSMTSTPTMDTVATVNQVIRLINAGSEYVRISTQNIKEALNLKIIKKELQSKGYQIPLIADVHFNPDIAIEAARIVEKVRINPGNYAKKRVIGQVEYTDLDYQNEIERIRERIKPLVNTCINHGTALRIGTNHGSLSDRIMSRYGDTPQGMVESSLEFIRICESLDFKDIVISMKASNILIMVQAYRLLVNIMMSENMNYPLHLGVTEAGDGIEGRIKSAAGIGALLEDGLGDTIRVSLTEDPEKEIPVAKILAERYPQRKEQRILQPLTVITFNPFVYRKRNTRKVRNIGGDSYPVVLIDEYPFNKLKLIKEKPDYLFKDEIHSASIFPFEKDFYENKQTFLNPANGFPFFDIKEYLVSRMKSNEMNFVRIRYKDLNKKNIELIKKDKSVVLILETDTENGIGEQRQVFFRLMELKVDVPVIIKLNYFGTAYEKLSLQSSADIAALLIDGLGDGIWIQNTSGITCERLLNISFGILQATRRRITKTEYIACPSCGRTYFDIQQVLQKIRERTHHLAGLKIGVMGCIVNGPGEMADADYGYVGSGNGKVTLYKRQEIMIKNVKTEDAVDLLVSSIKKYGDWIEPVS
ncbi:(E)-4-hydroxy-3-methylbut-2-enyl-diphosphate synthase [Bacteroidota bacterium]